MEQHPVAGRGADASPRRREEPRHYLDRMRAVPPRTPELQDMLSRARQAIDHHGVQD